MNLVISTISFLVIFMAISTAAVYAQSHRHSDDTPATYFVGDQHFKAESRYTLVLKSEEGRNRMHSLKQQKLKAGHKIALKSKPPSVEHEIYLELLDIFPSDTLFRVVEAEDTESGDYTVYIESSSPISANDVLGDTVLDFSETEDGNVITTILAPDLSIKSLQIPREWTKEDGYQKILEKFDAGGELVNVSVVFDLSGTKGKRINELPFAETIRLMQYRNLGRVYGYGSDNERKIGWWTQQLNLTQVEEVKEADYVINLIAHD